MSSETGSSLKISLGLIHATVRSIPVSSLRRSELQSNNCPRYQPLSPLRYTLQTSSEEQWALKKSCGHQLYLTSSQLYLLSSDNNIIYSSFLSSSVMSFTIPSLFALPTELIIDIFSRWLELSDLALLDSALLNRNYRKQYLFILRLYPWHSFDDGQGVKRQSACFIRFLLARQVSVSQLEFRDVRGQFSSSLLANTSVNKVSWLLRTVHTLQFDFVSGLTLDWLKQLLLNGEDLSQLH